jgi:hypothetical protein
MTFIAPCCFILSYNFGVAANLSLTCEMVRHFMKIHSYFREKVLFGVKGNPYATYIPADLKITEKDLCIPKIDVQDV